MPITNHVTSLDLSRRLRELKVPQKSYFVWKPLFENKKEGKWRVSTRAIHAEKYDGELVSAYIASELGEMLKKGLEKTWKGTDGKWRCSWTYSPVRDRRRFQQSFEGETEADARAKMLIYFIENHLISVEELGK